MKIYQALVVVLLCLVGWLAYLVLSNRGKPAGRPPAELWQTNAVERWHTNTVELWHTNTVTGVPANVANQVVTNIVTREIPAELSGLEKQAAIVGYKYLNAPTIDNPTDALYKATPLSVDVEVDENVTNLLAEDADALKKGIERVLTSRGITLAEKSPYHLNLRLTALWRTDVPKVGLLDSTLQLRQTVAVQRQNSLVQCPASVWSGSTAKLMRIRNAPEQIDADLQQLLDSFCSDYLKAKDSAQGIESRLPNIPSDFLSGGK